MRFLGQAVAGAALGLLALGFACGPVGEVSEDPMATLARAMGRQRYLTPQLSIELSHRYCRPPVSPLQEPSCGDHLADSRRLVSSLFENESPKGKHARALWLLQDANAGTREAIDMLEILANTTNDRQVASDLAAAYLLRAWRQGSPSDLLRGLDRAEGLCREAGFAPACWNTALLCEELGLSVCAVQAWERYLAAAPARGWYTEARLRQARLRHRHASPPTGRQALADLLRQFEATLGRWSTLGASPNVRQEALAEAGAIATTLAAAGDPLLRDALAVIEGAEREGDRATLAALLAGHRAHARAAVAHDARNPFPAERHFAEAAEAFTRAGSPFRFWSQQGLAANRILGGRTREGLQLLSRLRETTPLDYRFTHGRVAWVTGYGLYFLGRPLEALESYSRSLAFFEALGDRASALAVRRRKAEIGVMLGDSDDDWQLRLVGLLDRTGRSSPERYYLQSEAAAAAGKAGFLQAAQVLQREAIADIANPDPILRVLGWRQLATLRLQGSAPEDARSILREVAAVRRDLNGLAEPIARTERFGLDLIEGQAEMIAGDPERALAAFERSSALLRDDAYLADRPAFYELRARAERRLGRSQAVRSSLASWADAVIEQWRTADAATDAAANTPLMETFFASGREPFDEWVDELARAGEHDEALEVLERVRAFEFLQGGAAEEGQTLLERSARCLEKGETLVYYSPQPDHLWIFTRDVGGSRLHRVAVGLETLNAEVAELHRGIAAAADEPELEEILARLYDWLIRPLAADLEPGGEILLVPDRALYEVPFAALFDRESRRHLVEGHRSRVVPSATFHCRTQMAARAAPTAGPPSAALFGVPETPLSGFGKLPRLDVAAAEVEALAAFYPGSQVIVGAAATRERFLASFATADVLHFAGHAIAGRSLSLLVLSPGATGDPGTLYGSELRTRPRPATRLVFLAACSSFRGRPAPALAAPQLVRPLLAAGVPAVVGTLWDVDDRAAMNFSISFHRHFSAGEEAGEALRHAQLDLLHGRLRSLHSLRVWGAFSVFGTARIGAQKGT